MALEAKQKIYVKTRSNFDTLLGNGTIGTNHLVFIEDTQEIWTHGNFFSGKSFKSISDGTNTASSPNTTGVITFNGAGKVNVSVGNNGVTITGNNATVATGDSNGQVKIDGQNVSVKGWATKQDVLSFTSTPSSSNKVVCEAEMQSNEEVISAALTDLNDRIVDHTTDTSNPHSVTKAQVGLGNVTNESKATMFTSPTFTGIPVAPTAAAGTNTTQIATTAFVKSAVDGVLGASEAMIFKGTLGTGGTVTSLPASHQVGDTYKIITAGTYAGIKCEVGDMIICITTGTSSNNAHWTVVQTNIDGAVTGPASSTADHIATFSGTTGKVIKDSGYTIATSVPSGAVFTDQSVTAVGNHYTPAESTTKSASGATGTSGSTVQVITGIKMDAKGHVTSVVSGAATDTTYTGATLKLTGFTASSSSAAIAATDTANAAFGKLEYKIDTLSSNSEWAEYN